MERTDLLIHVLGDDTVESYNPSRDGKVKSSASELRVNKTWTGYGIIYDADVFEDMDLNVLTKSLIALLNKHLPDVMVTIGVVYDYDDECFEDEVAAKIVEFDAMLSHVHNTIHNVVYKRTPSTQELIEEMDDDEDDVDDDEDDDVYENMSGIDPDDGFDIYDVLRHSDKRHYKSKSPKYKTSRVLRRAKNPKRAVHRHGVLIASAKDDIRADAKIIKSFLKEFIPGNAEWKKDFRNDITKRWIRSYVVSKKQLKKLERKHRKTRNNRSEQAQKALTFTKKLLTPVDSWNDPRK